MTGRWSGSTRRARLPADWAARRRRILQRDGHQCTANELGQRCTQPATDVDHIQPGDNHDEHNLQSLCAWHHTRKTAAEVAAANARRPTTRRPAERHPGHLP